MRLAANECSVAPEASTSKMMLGKISFYFKLSTPAFLRGLMFLLPSTPFVAVLGR
jgi:hypothetical protein